MHSFLVENHEERTLNPEKKTEALPAKVHRFPCWARTVPCDSQLTNLSHDFAYAHLAMPASKLTSARAWVNRLARSRHALALLFVLSIMETLILPVPLELVLIPWMLCHPDRRWMIAASALAGNLTAALVGYYLGFFVMDLWGAELIDFFGDQETYEELKSNLEADGFVTILTIGLSPVPFQIAMLAAGATAYPVLLFGFAALLARGVRYFGLAALAGLIGLNAVKAWKRYALPLGMLILIVGCVSLWAKWSG